MLAVVRHRSRRPVLTTPPHDVARHLRPRLQICNCRPGCAGHRAPRSSRRANRHRLRRTDREDLYWLNRFRVTARFSIKPWLSAAVQAQDARVEGRNGPVAGAPFRDQFDLRLAHADVGNLERSRFAVRVGRQELAFGDQRLVGHVNWLNTARSFDAVRGVFRHKKIRVDGFAASVVTCMVDEFNPSGAGNYFYGADAPLALLPFGGVLEPYEFVRSTTQSTVGRGRHRHARLVHDRRSPGRQTLPGHRLQPRSGHPAGLARKQTISRRGRVTGLVGRTISSGRATYRVFGEYNYASGDDTPGDGRRGTFDQLYPTPHDKYGLADQVGWKNIHHVRAGLEFKPQPRLALAGGYHSFWLASARDALYNAGGAPIARIRDGRTRIDTSGRSSTCRRPSRHLRASRCTAGTRTCSPARFSKPQHQESPTAAPTSW